MNKSIWSDEEKTKLCELCAANKTLTQITNELTTKTKYQIQTQCKLLNISYKKRQFATWSDNDIKKLHKLCNTNKSLKRIAKEFSDKTEAQIRLKCKKLNIEYNKKHKHWTKEEIESFKKDWPDTSISNNQLRNKYKNRPMHALKIRAKKLNLPYRSLDDSYLSINDICSEMQVSKDRVHTWIKRGLKYHKSHINNIKYLIDPNDLLKFLKQHPDYYDASKISDCIFLPEPKWLTQKRHDDKENFRTRSKKAEYYSDTECRQIIRMFKDAKSNAEIAKALNRTESGIERILAILNYSRKHYNDYEIDILKKYHDKVTLDELVKMLPLRTRMGIINKCQQLKLKYTSKRNKITLKQERSTNETNDIK